jgi:hypothetical protein
MYTPAGVLASNDAKDMLVIATLLAVAVDTIPNLASR